MNGLVSFEHLCYWYPHWSGPGSAALFDVSLELRPGLTLLGGDSGAGKSTLLRVLNGLVPHFHGGRIAGGAVVAGMDVLSTPTRDLARQVGFVFQECHAGFVRGTVAREVAFTPENLGLAPAEVATAVGEALEKVGLKGFDERRLDTLSGGERQRVALAGALAAAPEVVALDEPTSQLDEAGVTALGAILDDLVSTGRTVVVAEQRLGRFPAASRSVVLSGGTLVEPRPGRPGTDPGRPCCPGRRGTDLRNSVASGTGGDTVGPQVWALVGVAAGINGRCVVDDVNLAGGAGEVVVLTGPNGGGKTTLLRTIAGLIPSLAGQAVVDKCRIAYLPQDPGALLHRASVFAEVRQTLRWSRSGEDPARILGALGLAELADRDPRDLSVGQRQRAAIAAVLAGGPRLALLDEPTRGMDAASRLALATTLRRLGDEGASVVVATHDAELAGYLGDRVIQVEGGHAVARPEQVSGART